MENIEFSKNGAAILSNAKLAKVLLRRIGNPTEEEFETGELRIPMEGGVTLIFQVGLKNHHLPKQSKSEKKHITHLLKTLKPL